MVRMSKKGPDALRHCPDREVDTEVVNGIGARHWEKSAWRQKESRKPGSKGPLIDASPNCCGDFVVQAQAKLVQVQGKVDKAAAAVEALQSQLDAQLDAQLDTKDAAPVEDVIKESEAEPDKPPSKVYTIPLKRSKTNPARRIAVERYDLIRPVKFEKSYRNARVCNGDNQAVHTVENCLCRRG